MTIADVKVRIDSGGRYSLNDLHKAAGGEARHKPGNWLQNQQAQELAAEIEIAGIPAITSKQGSGTFVAKQLVYAYAMWISAAFSLRVINAYDALVEGRLEDAKRIASRQTARLEAPYLTEAVKHRREAQGKALAHYHFSNEFDLINRVALGSSAKDFRIAHGLNPDQPIRDHLTKLEIRCVEHLQRANATMIDLKMEFEQRKIELHKLYVTRHAAELLSEVKRIES